MIPLATTDEGLAVVFRIWSVFAFTDQTDTVSTPVSGGRWLLHGLCLLFL